MADAAPAEERARQSLPILKEVSESQQQNGLRHDDYHRYRQYCSRRLRRVRKSVGLQQGKGKFQNKQHIKAEQIQNDRYLTIPLLCAERAWAYAMELNDENEDGANSRLRHHMLSRLDKAVTWAAELTALCAEAADDRTQLEAEAYAANMTATLLLKREEWMGSLEKHKAARKMYSDLKQLSLTQDDTDMYARFLNELVQKIQFCKYNVKQQGGDPGPDDEADELDGSALTPAMKRMRAEMSVDAASMREQQAASLSELSWRGRTVTVRSNTVKLRIVTAREELAAVKGVEELDAKQEKYSKVVIAMGEALGQLNRDIEEKASSKDHDEAEVSELRFLVSYLNCRRTEVIVERTLAQAEDTKLRLTINGERVFGDGGKKEGKNAKPEDLFSIYQTLIGHATQLLEEHGGEDNVAARFRAFTASRLLTYKALRCLYNGENHRVQRQWGPAYVLYERAAELAEEAQDRCEKVNKASGEVLSVDEEEAKARNVAELAWLVTRVDSLRPLVHAEAYLEQLSSSGVAADEKHAPAVLVDRLGHCGPQLRRENGLPILAHFPPAFEPVAQKPMLLDLASAHLSVDLEALLAKGTPVAAAGWFGGASSMLFGAAAAAPKAEAAPAAKGWFG